MWSNQVRCKSQMCVCVCFLGEVFLVIIGLKEKPKKPNQFPISQIFPSPLRESSDAPPGSRGKGLRRKVSFFGAAFSEYLGFRGCH